MTTGEKNRMLYKAFEEKYPKTNHHNAFDNITRSQNRPYFSDGYDFAIESMRCINCRHWREKALADKGWGICDNPKNEVKAGPLSMIRSYGKHNNMPEQEIEELVTEVENGIRYPEDFGCIFFEPNS